MGNSESDIVLLHDNILLPHWEEFADALKCYKLDPKGYGDQMFSTENVQLHSSVLDMLKEAFDDIQFKTLGFIRSFVDNNDGLKFLSHHIQINPRLKYIHWSNNPVDNVESIYQYLNVINDHPTLSEIPCDQICGEGLNGYDILPAVISLLHGSKTYKVELDSNNIRTNGGTLLSDLIMKNTPRLQILSLKDNHFTDNDIKLMSDALKHNTNLESIRFGEDMSDTSRSKLLQVIFDETSCNALVNSNHVCNIEGFRFDYDINNSSVSSSDTLGKKIRKKLYILFSMRNREGSNLHHLNLELGDDLLKLLPSFFQFVVHNSPEYKYGRSGIGGIYYSDKNKTAVCPLSIVYEVIRKLPSRDDVSKKMESGCVIS